MRGCFDFEEEYCVVRIFLVAGIMECSFSSSRREFPVMKFLVMLRFVCFVFLLFRYVCFVYFVALHMSRFVAFSLEVAPM